jgi:tetratricopeptide (TPR) repeat protein
MPQGLKPRLLFRGIIHWKDRSPFLKTVFLSGIILALLSGAALALGSLLRPAAPAPAAGDFYRSLRGYDAALHRGGQSPEPLSRILDKLEKEAQGVEALLSVLKRRRALAQANPAFIPPYREAARKAAAAYPYSEPLAALAAASLLWGSAISGNTAAELKTYIPLLSAAEFCPLRVSLHVLLGDFKSPAQAGALPHLDSTLAAAMPLLRGRLDPRSGEDLAVDLAILRLLGGDAQGAAAEIQGGLRGNSALPSPEFLRFAAEYFYDYGDPLRSAELFSRLETPADIIRQADALWLSGRPANARNIWAALVSPAGLPVPPAITARALYNLAASAGNDREAAAPLERLITLAPDSGEAGLTYGIIRYSRIQNTPRSLAILEEGLKRFPRDILLELELLRRRGESWEPGRVIGETWLLLGRYPQAEELYLWGAWYFDRQRRPGETALLLKTAARQGINPPPLRIHEALGFMEEGNLDRAEDILRAIPPEAAGWEAAANLGRILEARRSPAAAISAYETAASAVPDRQEAARIQIRIAGCLKTLNRGQETRRVLEYALDLDPDSLAARLELSRLGQENF